MDLDTLLLLFRPLMSRFERLYGDSYICIFKKFDQASNFVHMFNELFPNIKVVIRGLYVRIMLNRGHKLLIELKKYEQI